MSDHALTLLSGDAQTFRAEVWASRTHLHKGDPEELGGLLTLDDVDRLLTGSALRTPALRVVRDGRVLPESAYTRRGASLAGKPLTGLVDARRTLRHFDDGATLVLQGLHRYWQPIGDLVAALELELGHPCQANAYLTPPGSQGFAVHRDSHDVFVVQTFGTKLWEVHPGPGEQPAPEGPDAPDAARAVLLEPGLSMYLPTGTPHAARAQDTASLHVTLGINQVTWRSVVERTVRSAVAGVDDAHLPAGYLDDPAALASGLADRLEHLAAQLRATDTTEVATTVIERFRSGRATRMRGGLRDLLAVDAITDATTLVRRPGRPCALVDAGERVRVLIGDRELGVPAWVRPALEVVAARDELRPVDLAEHLDSASRLVLCRRLVREGLLEVAP